MHKSVVTCRDGEIGRRTGFRCLRWQHHAGSNPALGTSLRPKGLRLAAPLYKVEPKSVIARCGDCPDEAEGVDGLLERREKVSSP